MSETKISAILTVEGLRKFQNDMGAAADAVDDTGRRGVRAGDMLARAGRVGFLAAGAAAIVSVKKFASFDDALNRVQINSGASAKEMGKLEKVARTMGEKFPASATEVAEAMNEILKAGMSVEDMLSGGLENALAMATAEGMDMSVAAKAMSNSMNTFGVAGKDAAQVTAALSNVASKTSADVNDLTLSLGQVGGTADTAGWSIGETTAALGILIQRGLTGSKAGTSLNNMLSRMMSAGGEAKAAMKDLGIEVYDASGEMKSADAVITELSDAMNNNMSSAERNGLLMKAFGIDGLDAARNLGLAQTQVRALTAETQNFDAPVQKARDQMKSLAMQLDTTGESLGNMAMQVGGALAPAVAAALPAVQSLAATVGESAQGFVEGAADAASFALSAGDMAASLLQTSASGAAATSYMSALSSVLSSMPLAEMAGGAAAGAAAMALIVAGAMAAQRAVLALTAAIMANPAIAIAVIGAAAAGAAIAGVKAELKESAADADSAAAAVRGLDAAIAALSPEGAKNHAAAMLEARSAANDWKLAIENLARVNKSTTATDAQVEQATIAVTRAYARKTAAADAAKVSTDEQKDAVDSLVDSYKQGGPEMQRATADVEAMSSAVEAATLGIVNVPDVKVDTNGPEAKREIDSVTGAVKGVPPSKNVTITVGGGAASALETIRLGIDSIRDKTVTVRTRQAKADGGPVVAMASGGRVTGPGTGRSDSVPAMLSAGEWVLTAKQAKAIGYGQLAALPKFAQGGAWFTSQANAMRSSAGSGGAHWRAMELAGRSEGLADDRNALAQQSAAITGRLNAVRGEAAAGKGDTLKANNQARAAAISELQDMLKETNARIWQIDNIGMPAANAANQQAFDDANAAQRVEAEQAAATQRTAAESAAATQRTAAESAAAAARQSAAQSVGATGSALWKQSSIAGTTAALDDDLAVLNQQLAALQSQGTPEAGARIAETEAAIWTMLNITMPAQQRANAQAAAAAVGAKGTDLWKRSSLAATTATLDDDLVVLQERLAALQAIGPEAAAQIADAEADIWTMLNITMPAEAAAAQAQQDAWRNEAAMALGRGFYSGSGGAGGGGNMGTTDTTGGGASGVGHAPRPEIDRVWLAGVQLNDLDARTGHGCEIVEILGWDEAEDFESTRSKRADGDALGGTRDGSVKLVVRGRLRGSSYQDYHERRRALKSKVRAAVDQTLLKVPDVTHGDAAGDYPDAYSDSMTGMERRIVRLVANLTWGDPFGTFGSEFEFELRSPHRFVEADVAATAPSTGNGAAVAASSAARTSILAIRGEIAAAPATDAALKFAGTSAESVLAVRAASTDAAVDTFTKLADPSSLPAGLSQAATFSMDGTYLAVAEQNSPRVNIYKRSGDAFTKLPNPADLPSGSSYGASFDSSGAYLAVVHATSPYVTIYKRSGDTFTKLPNPSSLPANAGNGVSFDPTGTYLAIAHFASPYVTIYKRSGDTFTKLPNPADLPASTARSAAFDPTSTYLAIGHSNSPYVTIYKRSGDTFTKLPNPADLPASTGFGSAFSMDGAYLAVAHATSPYITIYKRSGDTFTKIANPGTLPAAAANGVSFDPSDTYLAVAHDSSPYITIYKRSGDTFTKLPNPGTLPTGNGYGAAIDPSGSYLAVAHATAPFVTIYAMAGSDAAFDPLGTLGVNPPALAISGRTDTMPVASADISAFFPLRFQDAFDLDTIAGTATPVHRSPLARLIGGGTFIAGIIPSRYNGGPTTMAEIVTRSAPVGAAIDALGALAVSPSTALNESSSGFDDYVGLIGPPVSGAAQVATGMPGWRAKISGANFTASSYVRRRIDAALGQPKNRPVIHTMMVKPAASWATATSDLNAFGSGVAKFAHLITLDVRSGSINYINAVGFHHNGTRLVPCVARYDDKATDAYRLTFSSGALSVTPNPTDHRWVVAILDAGSNVWNAIILVDINTGEPIMWFVEGHDMFDGAASEITGAASSQAMTATTSGTRDSSVAYPTAATRYLGCGSDTAGWAASVAGTTVPSDGMGPIITLDAAGELFDHGITSAAMLTDASTATQYAAISSSIVEWVRARFAPQTIRRTPIALEVNWSDRVPDLHGEPIVRIDSVVASTTEQALGASRTGGLATDQMNTTPASFGVGATPIEMREVR